MTNTPQDSSHSREETMEEKIAAATEYFESQQKQDEEQLHNTNQSEWQKKFNALLAMF